MKTKFEQPGQLNRFVDESIPLTWSFRWRILKITGPILVWCGLCGVEMVGLTHVKAWLEGIPSKGVALPLLVGAVGPILILALVLEASLRMSQRTRRVLEIDDKGIVTQHTKRRRVPWDRVFAFRVEPIASEANLAKINVCMALARKSKTPRTWSIALDRKTQLQALLSELRRGHEAHDCFGVQEFHEPLPPKKTYSGATISMWLCLLGVTLLLHGLPLIRLGLSSDRAPQTPSRHENEPPAAFRRFILAHFKSVAELRKATWVTGSVLTGVGVLCLAWGWRSLTIQGKRNEEEMNKEIEQEANRSSDLILRSARR